MDWSTFVARFARYQRLRALSPRTIKVREETLMRLSRLVEDLSPLELTEDDLETALDRDLKPATRARERSDVQAFFQWLQLKGYRDDDPSRGLPPIRVHRGEPRPYTLEQISAMLSSGSYQRTRVMILLAYLVGLRAHEIAKMHGHDVDWEARTLRVEGKGGKVAWEPIHPVLWEAIQDMPREDWWFRARGTSTLPHIHWRSVSNLMSEAKRRAGIHDASLTGHSLRHSFGTEQVRAGVNMRVIQENMRHASLTSTQVYTGVTEAQRREAIESIPAPVIPIRSGRRRQLPKAA